MLKSYIVASAWIVQIKEQTLVQTAEVAFLIMFV